MHSYKVLQHASRSATQKLCTSLIVFPVTVLILISVLKNYKNNHQNKEHLQESYPIRQKRVIFIIYRVHKQQTTDIKRKNLQWRRW